MDWSLLAIAAIGLLVGTLFRASAVIATSFSTIAASAAVMWLLDFSAHSAVLSTFYLVVTLQGAYLLGLAVATLRSPT